MNDDALRAIWNSSPPGNKDGLIRAMTLILEEDRVARERDRWVRRITLFAVALLCPALLWFAAHGKTPLVRGGYALMAVGTAILLFAEWMHHGWFRQAMPGPVDGRSHLQKTALLLSRQANLFRTAPLWCAPIFVGAGLIGVWIYQERSISEGYSLWLGIGAAWLVSVVGGFAKGKQLDERRSRVEMILNDFEAAPMPGSSRLDKFG